MTSPRHRTGVVGALACCIAAPAMVGAGGSSVRAAAVQPISEFSIIPEQIASHSRYITGGPNGVLWLTAPTSYVSNGGAGVVRVALNGSSASYTTVPFTDPTQGAPVLQGLNLDITDQYESISPAGITTGADGNIWFAMGGYRSLYGPTPQQSLAGSFGLRSVTYVERMAPDGSGATAFAFPGAPPDMNVSMVSGPDGNLWISKPLIGAVARLTPGPTVPASWLQMGTETDFTVPSTGETSGLPSIPGVPGTGGGTISTTPEDNGPGDLVVGLGNAIWFPAGSAVGRVTMDGHVDTFALSSGARVQTVVKGPDGAMWFWAAYTDGSGGEFGRVSSTGTVTENVIHTGPSVQVEALAVHKDATIWFTDSGTDTVGEFRACSTLQPVEYHLPNWTNPGGDAMQHHPMGIVLGSDDNIWFTEWNAPYVGRVNLNMTGALPLCHAGAQADRPHDGSVAPPRSGNLGRSARWNFLQ